MSVRHLLTTVAVIPLSGLVFAMPAAAHAAVQPTAAVTGMTAGRLGPTLTALVGLIGVIGGTLALTCFGGRIGTATRVRGAIVALVAGPISVVLGVLFTATAAGGPGTGNGIVGAVIAAVLGMIGTTLGGVAMARSRRTG